ncbi:MAG TPA: copper oxidase [Thermoanaerobaculia bacterium]
MPRLLRFHPASWMLALLLLALSLPGPAQAQVPTGCSRLLRADVVAFDQVFFWNRLGAIQPQGMMYALRRDVVPISGSTLSAGNVRLRLDKRPRPIVLRMNVGDCLRIDFQNLLAPTKRDQEQPATRWASIHAVGAELLAIGDDGSFVGQNANSLADVGQSRSYFLYAEREGEHVLFSAGATNGGQGDGGSTNSGLFGALIIEPVGSVWYRSQVTRDDLDRVTTGTTQFGQPIINYAARYPAGHPRAGMPILAMLDGTEIVHTDLTALIAGTGGQRHGWFPPSTFPPNVHTYPERHQPFREFTIIYHDEIGAVQAFPEFEDAVLEHTLHGGRDGFAINYGTGGIGAEILANRLRVGPMHNCVECKFEEFFLASWVVGDPAMIVDKPANRPCGPETTSPNTVGQDPNLPTFVSQLRNGAPCTPLPNAKATKAFFPDDPSNVYHGYLSDHTKFRVLHAGTKEHHIHHLHAHQWLFTADSDKSTYLDSQALGPGSSFTAEIAYNGGGNLNKTVGDAIFHCHFYPHFAQGMWSLWRVHDVFERGTALDANGRPAAGSRALPDGEIAAGTPIPAVVPLPGIGMAPLPQATASIVNGQVQVTGAGNPGYPFFIPAVAGHRPPKPPLDTIHDGGLPRHNITGGTFVEAHTRLDWHKELLTAVAQPLAETGTAVEEAAMDFHAQGGHMTCEPNGNCANLACPPNPSLPCTPVTFECEPGNTCVDPMVFRTNGRGRVSGAPYANPCPVEETPMRLYKAADIQTDVKINKKGWHFPQQRFTALWEDVGSYLNPPFGSTKKPPEPLFFRANSGDCIQFWLTNLVPNEYELDDFQVRTPTDILGQHIHLVKFDVTASDGAANGFNYEDGSFSPEEVRERINAIRAQNGCTASDPRNGSFTCPVARAHPFFGAGTNNAWLGAQTTAQLWYADPLLDNVGNDRTLRTVFTHDHFGPSTHQQAGLYAGLVVEPTGSTWKHNETGTAFYTRADGGPTSWQAVITSAGEDYREFLLEFGDFQLAYEEDSSGFPDPNDAVNPPGRKEIGIPDLLARPDVCPGGVPPPCPEIISADDPGTMSVNYRQEPIALRVRNPATNSQASGNAGDLSFAFSSNHNRSDTAFNVQPNFYAPLTFDLNGRDPWTPLLRAYENDRVQIRVLVGAHEEGHNFSVHGIKWLFEPSEPNSGYRNSQMMGISEHFEFIVPQLIKNPMGAYVDRLYSVGSSTDDYWNGIWGLLRAYTGLRPDLEALDSNPNGGSGIDPSEIGAFEFSCPKNAPVRTFDVTAVAAQQALPGGRLIYNSRTDGMFGPLFDPTSILYVRTSDLNATTGQLNPGVPIEPLVLRARAGECIKLTLRNRLPEAPLDLNGFNTLPMLVEGFNANDIKPSRHVGLHPQMLYYDVSRFDAANVGGNSVQTVAPGQLTTYEWYAGDVRINPDGSVTVTPIEFGATNLISSDRIEHASKGAIAALIIEPPNAVWAEGGSDCVLPAIPTARCPGTFADVYTESTPGGPQVFAFREFALLFQNDVNMRTDVEMPRFCPGPSGGVVTGHGAPVENLACIEDPEDSGQKAINYRTEPLWKRMQHAPGTPLEQTRDFPDWHDVVSNTKVGTMLSDPETPVFRASSSENNAIRFRLLQPGGHSRNIVFALHGHVWDKEPYVQNSTRIGHNGFSFWEGAHMGHGPSNHFDALIRHGAGGKFSVVGDFLFRDQVSTGFDNGLWGILRVE